MVLAVILAVMVGVSLGLLGGGGSILTVPILRYVLGLEAHTAIAMSLLLVGATSAAALAAHARRGLVQWRTGFAFGCAGMLGAYPAGRIAHFIPESLLLLGFGLMMFATAAAMLRPERKPSSAQILRASRPRRLPLLEVLMEGLVVGAVTGLVGAGGGFLVVPALVLLGRLPMQAAIATSLLVISLKSFAGFAGFLGHTQLDWSLALAIGSASVLGSFAGAALANKVSTRALRQGFGWFVIGMAIFILAQELPPLLGYPARPAIALAVALFATTAAYAVRVRLRARARRAREGSGAGPRAGTSRSVSGT